MAPAPSPHSHLPIRTAKQPGKQSIQQAPSSSSSQQAYPEYPIKIPPEKQEKALELYVALKLEEVLAQNDMATDSAHRDGYHLTAPGPSTARSVRSQTSSKGRIALSTSASAYDAMTDYGSVVSFNQQSPTSATELTSFDGRRVRTRKRNKLSPTARAKAALVRYLGSCPPCRARRVPCPLEDHHDVQCLEALRILKEETRPEPQPSPLSATSSSSQRTARSITKQEPTSNSSVDNTLFGMGAQLAEFDPREINTQLDMDMDIDILSSGPEGNYDNTQAERPALATLNLLAPNLTTSDPNPYATFQHGAPFLLGCFRDGQFQCFHLQRCLQRLDTADELQNHFATKHFEYTRIYPAHRFICSKCNLTSLFPNDPCSCGTLDNIEMWICGHFIKRPWYQRESSDGTDFQGYQPGSKFDSPSFGGSNTGAPGDPNPNNGGNVGGGFNNQGPSNYQGAYDRTGNQGFRWNGSNGSGSGSNQYQRNFFGARQMALDGQYSFQIWCSKVQPKGWHLNWLLILLLLLFAVAFGLTHNWVVTKARMETLATKIGPHVAVLGFAILTMPIVMQLLIQHLTFRRAREVSITIILDHLAKKRADDFQRDLDVLCKLLQTLVYRLHTDQLDLNIICVASFAYDRKRGDDLTLMPSTKHEVQHPP